MGKQNQLGTLDEVISLCKIDSRLVPVVDFGHLNARDCGNVFLTTDDYSRVFDKIALHLGDQVARNMHCHFSKIEWTGAGEKRLLTFEYTVYGPHFEPLMEALVRDRLTPTVICESAGTQSADALIMKTYYRHLKGETV
jgi:deoxyribonuclease-4